MKDFTHSTAIANLNKMNLRPMFPASFQKSRWRRPSLQRRRRVLLGFGRQGDIAGGVGGGRAGLESTGSNSTRRVDRERHG